MEQRDVTSQGKITTSRKSDGGGGERRRTVRTRAPYVRHFMNAHRGRVCVRTCVRAYTYARPYYERTAEAAAAAVHSCGALASVFVARSARSKYPYAGDACVRDKWRARWMYLEYRCPAEIVKTSPSCACGHGRPCLFTPLKTREIDMHKGLSYTVTLCGPSPC